jgi:hypothetical protein
MPKTKDKKQKRKKGKKFIYRDPNEQVVKKKNPFEDQSKKKVMKVNQQYNGLINSYQDRNSSNTFVDRRIGENSKNLSYDDKMKLRFKAQQMVKVF